MHGIQKVRGSNPLGSTKFLYSKSPLLAPQCRAHAAVDTLFDTLRARYLPANTVYTDEAASRVPHLL